MSEGGQTNRTSEGGQSKMREGGQAKMSDTSLAKLRELGQMSRADGAAPGVDPPVRRAARGMQADLAQRLQHQPKPGFFARLFKRGTGASKVAGGGKASNRHPCCMVGVLMLLDRNLALDGLIMGINETSVLFRQASTFIFDREGAEIAMRFGEYDRRGKISDVTPNGYVVRFSEPLHKRDVQALLQAYGAPG